MTTISTDATGEDLDAGVARAALAAAGELDRWVAVELRGELDVASAPGLRRRLLGLVADHDGRSFVLDLSGLTFVGTAGLAVVVAVERALRERGDELALVGISAAARRLLDLAGIAATPIVTAPVLT